MVELAAGGPHIRQRTIAEKLGITPQAISDYMKQLDNEKLITSASRFRYRVTPKGVNWMLNELRNLRSYLRDVERYITSVAVTAAIADTDIKEGQTIGLEMRDGILIAHNHPETAQAHGVAVSSVKKGEDVDVADIQGLVELAHGKVTILRVPAVQKGGSRNVNINLLKSYVAGDRPVGSIGLESLVALRRAGVEPRYLYGAAGAAVEIAQSGISFTVACVEDWVPELMKKLREESIEYELVDLSAKKSRRKQRSLNEA